MKRLLATLLLLNAATLRAEDTPPTTAALQKSVEKSLRWLQDDMTKWRADFQCAACHHGPMYLWTMHAARRQGYAVDEPRLKEMTTWLLTSDEARIFPKPDVSAAALAASTSPADRMTAAMRGHNQLSQPTLYLAHALNAMPHDDPARAAGWKRILTHWNEAQHDDGSFVGRKGRPPVFNTPQILTRYAALALDAGRPTPLDLTANETATNPAKRAARFLATQTPDETHHGLILRLWATARQPAPSPSNDTRSESDTTPPPAESLTALIEKLRRLQRPDGGWSQSDDRPSDAFATGQTLYVLKQSGLDATDPAIHRGLTFLHQTQQPDGTWEMTSRPDPATTPGKPADFLNPITYAGTAWAVLGITSHVPAPKSSLQAESP